MQQKLNRGILAAVGISMAIALPAIAQSENLKTLTLDSKTTSGMMLGSTGGTTSLPAVVGEQDRQKQKCLGFGDPKPDHTIVLKQPFSTLTIRVDSGGNDTTLLVSGPDGLRCADSGANKDAKLQEGSWQPGTYQVWVGTVAPSTNRDYRLIVRGKN